MQPGFLIAHTNFLTKLSCHIQPERNNCQRDLLIRSNLLSSRFRRTLSRLGGGMDNFEVSRIFGIDRCF